MRLHTWLALTVVTAAVAALPTSAEAVGLPIGPPVRVDAGINWRFNVYVGPAANRPFGGALAPWYSYFPYQPVPAPAPAYPHWPAQTPPAAPARPANAFLPPAPAVRPVGYWHSAPSYWYGQ